MSFMSVLERKEIHAIFREHFRFSRALVGAPQGFGGLSVAPFAQWLLPFLGWCLLWAMVLLPLGCVHLRSSKQD